MRSVLVHHSRLAILGSILVLCSSTVHATSLNVAFFGNSFTLGQGSSRSVSQLFRDIAIAAGHDGPRSSNFSASGQDLPFHVNRVQTNPGLLSLPAGESWDFVVMQDFSTRPTHVGNLALHRSAAVQLYQEVAAHSPSVGVTMFETWARAPGHSFYSGATPSFPGGPAQMQQELRDGYALSSGDINALAGMGTARVAPVGDAWEVGNWNQLHAGDLYHAQNRGTLLAGLVMYGTMYSDPSTADIDLSIVLTALGLTAQEGTELTSYADAVLLDLVDFNADGVVDELDIDALVGEAAAGTNGAAFDLSNDGLVDVADINAWLVEAGQINLGASYLIGDANLDGTVDGGDFLAWNANKFNSTAAWTLGDFNGDGVSDGIDFLLWNGSKFQSSARPVPEPNSAGCVVFVAVLAFWRKWQWRLRSRV